MSRKVTGKRSTISFLCDRANLLTLAGLLCIVGGIFGFLPILGFWMIPVGLYFIAMEVPALRKPLRTWINRHKHALRRARAGSDQA